MTINGATVLSQLNEIVPGFGIKKSVDMLGALRDTNGAPLTNSTTPAITTLETNAEGVEVSSGATLLGKIIWQIPRDYDDSADYFRIRALCNSNGTTDTPTIDATIYRKRAETELSSDLDPTISSAMNNSTNKADWVEINADSLSLQPGDVLTITISTSAHTTDDADFYALEFVYKSTIVYSTETDR